MHRGLRMMEQLGMAIQVAILRKILLVQYFANWKLELVNWEKRRLLSNG